jgi:beta-galactosidase
MSDAVVGPISPKLPKLFHGGDYNPDQWPREILEDDVWLMKLANTNVMSVGIFSWAQTEVAPGRFEWEWLDETMDRLHAAGVSVALATPSASPPRWMGEMYPEILKVDPDGRRVLPGERVIFCQTSPIYRERISHFNRLLAERYGNHPAVVMWHVSNEYAGGVRNQCHCDLCEAAFQQFLQRRYGDIETLNHQWWTRFWSNTYNDFSEIHTPKTYANVGAIQGQILDWNRFCTHQVVDFFKNEIAPLREVAPHIPVTTNIMGMYDGLDYTKFGDVMDVISWDSYPEVGGDPSYTAWCHSLMRAMKDQNPWLLMEQTPSSTNWHGFHRLKPPGVMRMWSWAAMGHGSDGAMYFQWRRCKGGQEKMHGAVVAHVGHEHTRVFGEVSELGREMDALSGEVVGTRVTAARVGVLWNQENRWALNGSCGPSKDKGVIETATKHFRAIWKLHTPIDIVRMDADWSQYDMLIAPTLYMLKSGHFPLEGTPEELKGRIDEAAKIREWINNGGTFVTTHLTGYVNENDHIYDGGYPGPLRDVLGIWSEEIDNHPIGEATNELVLADELNLPGGPYACDRFFDLIHAEGADVLATYGKNWYAGRAAITRNAFGDGQAWYLAGDPEEAFLIDFYRELFAGKGIEALGCADDQVEMLLREGSGRSLLFLLNHTDAAQTVDLLGKRGVDLLTGESCDATCVLEAHGVRIIKLD